MELLCSFLEVIQPVDFLALLDFTETYVHVPILLQIPPTLFATITIIR